MLCLPDAFDNVADMSAVFQTNNDVRVDVRLYHEQVAGGMMVIDEVESRVLLTSLLADPFR